MSVPTAIGPDESGSEAAGRAAESRCIALGTVAAASHGCGGSVPGMTPEEMLAEIRRHSTFTADEFEALSLERPIDPRLTHRTIKAMLDAAEAFIREVPSEAVRFLFLDGQTPVQPDPSVLDR